MWDFRFGPLVAGAYTSPAPDTMNVSLGQAPARSGGPVWEHAVLLEQVPALGAGGTGSAPTPEDLYFTPLLQGKKAIANLKFEI